MMESRKAQISAVAALDEPIRPRLHDYVVRQPRPVSRDDAAAGLQLPRTTAAFRLDRLMDEGLRVLQAHGFEPRIEGGEITLVNCPFHTLAQDYTELVCGMNLRLLNGLLDGLALTGLTAHLNPAPPHCCVRLQPAAHGSGAQRR